MSKQIGISSYRRCKMRIILKAKPKMSYIISIIYCLLSQIKIKPGKMFQWNFLLGSFHSISNSES